MRKLIAAALLLVLIGIILYHYEAADQAEREVDRALREMVSGRETAAGIQFSDVEIAPFSGTLTIYDLDLFTERHLYRGRPLRLELGYLNFLRIYLGNPSDVLDQRLSADGRAVDVTWMDRYRLREIRFDTLELHYDGNPRALMRHLLLDSALTVPQSLEGNGRGFSFTDEMLAWGSLRADTLRMRQELSAGNGRTTGVTTTDVELRGLSWGVSRGLREQYGILLRGFDYPGGEIPLKSARAAFEYDPGDRLLHFRETRLVTEHFRLGLNGELILEEPLGGTSLDGLTVTVSDYSDRFRNMLGGLNRLFQLDLPSDSDSLALPLGGTLENPVLRRGRL